MTKIRRNQIIKDIFWVLVFLNGLALGAVAAVKLFQNGCHFTGAMMAATAVGVASFGLIFGSEL
jgi:hypothetical protein